MKVIIVAGALMLALPGAASAQTPGSVQVGVASGSFCFPLSCGGIDRFQQVYSAGAFPGPVTINGLDFFHTFFERGIGQLNSARFDLYFSTTTATPTTLSSTLAANVTSPEHLFGSYTINDDGSFLGGAPTFHWQGDSTFYYDTSLGNLLLDLRITNLVRPLGVGDANLDWTQNADVGSAFESNGYAPTYLRPVLSGEGIVTQFDYTTPEPASLALLGTGLVGLVPFARRRRAR